MPLSRTRSAGACQAAGGSKCAEELSWLVLHAASEFRAALEAYPLNLSARCQRPLELHVSPAFDPFLTLLLDVGEGVSP